MGCQEQPVFLSAGVCISLGGAPGPSEVSTILLQDLPHPTLVAAVLIVRMRLDPLDCFEVLTGQAHRPGLPGLQGDHRCTQWRHISDHACIV